MDEVDVYTPIPGHTLTVVTPVTYTGGGQYGRRYQTGVARYACGCGALAGADETAVQAHLAAVRADG